MPLQLLHTYVTGTAIVTYGHWEFGNICSPTSWTVNLRFSGRRQRMTKTQNRGRRTAKGGDNHSFLLMSTLTLRTLLNPLGFQIILRNIFNQLVQKSFLSTPQHGSSMINQNSWIRYFDPNDMLWKEPDVEWRTRATGRSCSPRSCGGVWPEGEWWIGEALVGCHWS